jgi:TrmH family RNA methyltransferase
MTDRIRFVLVRPEEPENVGAVARVLRNFGFEQLTLVASHLARPERAYVVAHGAGDLLQGADHVDDLAPAIGACVRAFATSRRAGKHRGGVLPLREAAQEAVAAPGPVAWVFGPESTGLTAGEIARCSDRVLIPTAPRHPSLNLAQAVAVVAYELYLAERTGPRVRVPDEASLEERDALYRHLESALSGIGFLDSSTARVRMGQLRRLLERARPSAKEVRFLRGIARRMERRAHRKG